MKRDENSLPYTDTKPVGAADFYFAINATFRFILDRAGSEGLRRYWTDLGTNYFAPVSKRWKQGSFSAVADYWRAFFKAEPGAEVDVDSNDDMLRLDVKICPAIKHLRENGRVIVPCFCHHCYFVNEAIAAPAGLTVRIVGGNGTCRQTFYRRSQSLSPQDMAEIIEATC